VCTCVHRGGCYCISKKIHSDRRSGKFLLELPPPDSTRIINPLLYIQGGAPTPVKSNRELSNVFTLKNKKDHATAHRSSTNTRNGDRG
jgi:hypothetical protein